MPGRWDMSPAAMVKHSPATMAARQLRYELQLLGVPAEVHAGDGVALLSVGGDLVVWCEPGPRGWRFRWWTGRVCGRTGHYVYTQCRTLAVRTAAQRIADRYAQLLRSRWSSPLDA